MLFSLDETRSSSAFSFSSITNTVVSASWCISLDKYNTFGYGEGSAGGFRVPKPLRVQCQTFFMNCSRARSIVFVEQNPIQACRSGSIGSSKTTPSGISKTQEVLVLSNEKGRHFVDQSNTNRIPDARNSALDRHLPTQMHFLNIDMRSRSTPDDPNAFLALPNALALDACRAKCIS